MPLAINGWQLKGRSLWWGVALDNVLDGKGKMKQQRRWGEGVHKDNKHTTNMHMTMMIMMQMQQNDKGNITSWSIEQSKWHNHGKQTRMAQCNIIKDEHDARSKIWQWHSSWSWQQRREKICKTIMTMPHAIILMPQNRRGKAKNDDDEATYIKAHMEITHDKVG